MIEKPGANITEDEAQLYDRQVSYFAHFKFSFGHLKLHF